jgi:hypothetical protein
MYIYIYIYTHTHTRGSKQMRREKNSDVKSGNKNELTVYSNRSHCCYFLYGYEILYKIHLAQVKN